MGSHDIGGKEPHEVNYDHAGNHPQAREMGLMMTDGSEKVIQVCAEYTVSKAEEKLQDEDGNPERYHDEQPGAELLFQMVSKIPHDTLLLTDIHIHQMLRFRIFLDLQPSAFSLNTWLATMKDTRFSTKVNMFQSPENCLRGVPCDKPLQIMPEIGATMHAAFLCNVLNRQEHSS
jgi:hypothetical protein